VKIIFWLMVAVAGFAADAGARRAQADALTIAEAQREYDRLSADVAAKNWGKLTGFFAADARLVDVDGAESDLASFTANMAREWQQLRDVAVRIAVAEVSQEGDEALIAGSWHVTGVLERAGATSRVRSESSFQDHWRKTNSVWRILRSATMRERLWLDDGLRSDHAFDPPPSGTERASLVKEAAGQAIALDLADAGGNSREIALLDTIIADARIVALGEQTHGSAEFRKMWLRLLEHLIVRKGFGVVAIESGWPESDIIDRFIRLGEGDASTATRSLYFPWRTEEIRDIIAWLRQLNMRRAGQPPVSFAAFDFESPAGTVKCVTDVFGKLSQADQQELQRLYHGANQVGADTPVKTELRDQAAAALKLVEARHEAIVAASSSAEFRRVRHCASLVHLAHERSIKPQIRDSVMADNVRWLMEEAYPDQKIIILAHNGHVGTYELGTDGEPAMGAHLRERFADQMLVLAQATNDGYALAYPVKDGALLPGGAWAPMKLGPAAPNSVEALLREVELPRLLLDLRHVVRDGLLAKWLSRMHRHRQVGVSYDPDAPFYPQSVLPKTFDALIFIRETSAAKALP
jgi:erythromycin esterase